MYDTTASVRNICGIIGLTLHWLIYLPLMLYYFKKFYDSRNEIALQKRHVNLCYITFIILFISIMIDRTCWWLFISQLFEPAIWIMLVTYPPITLGIHYCMLFRFWMVRYDFEYSFISSNFQWQKLINSQFVTDYQLKTNWWLLNRNTYGNDLWLAKRFFVPFICLVTISYITWGFAYIDWYHELIPSLVDLLFIIIPMICCAILYFKTPIIEDSFFIRSEMKLIFAAYGCLLLAYCLWWILVVILRIQWFELIEAYSIVITHFSIFIIMSKHATSDSDSNTNNNSDITVNLPQILSNEHTFSTFMNHVMSEWSIEILISFVELTQFLQFLVDKNNDLKNKFEKYNAIRFPLTVPKTSLIADNASTAEAKQIGVELYEKYLNSNSNLCINISYDLNMRVWNCLNKQNAKHAPDNISNIEIHQIQSIERNTSDEHDEYDEIVELFALFDQVRTEMYALLRHSFSRFKKSNEYYKIVQSKEEICKS